MFLPILLFCEPFLRNSSFLLPFFSFSWLFCAFLYIFYLFFINLLRFFSIFAGFSLNFGGMVGEKFKEFRLFSFKIISYFM